jgi:heat shock protein HslJ/uncharacterized membrane protein
MPPKPLLFVSVFVLFCLFGCQSGQESKKTAIPNSVSESKSDLELKKSSSMAPNSNYFSAEGSSPMWNLEISEDRITLKTTRDTLTTPHTKPEKAMDHNIRRYHLQTEATELIITIDQQPCEPGTNNARPYRVAIAYKPTAESDFTSLRGCGSYLMDYRLHDIWALETLNGKAIVVSEGLERPYLEINSRTNAFMGTASCNQMRGKVFFEPGLLRFTEVITTRKLCPGNLESQFLEALQSSIHYTLGDNRLRLTNPNGVEVVFKKID